MKSEKNNSKRCTPFEQIVSSQVDVKAGKMTFGQRIGLGEIFQSDASDVDKFRKAIECLHNYQPSLIEMTKLVAYFNNIIDGIRHWIEQETSMLKHEPSPEEIQAGIAELTTNIGQFGTIKAIAKAYGKDPDDILQWEYAKVFGILYSDLEEHKYQQRYAKVLEAKYKTN